MGGRNPDVWIEELESGPRPIEAVGTSVAAFIGSLETGPFDDSYVSSWLEFSRRWPTGSALATAVEEFFRNGGSVAWVAPVKRLSRKAVRRAIEAMDRDVALVAVVADPAAPPNVIGAAAEALTHRRAMLLVEGPWADAASALEAMSADRPASIGAGGPDVAVYWPRVRRSVGGGGVEEISPLGPVAGVISRTDNTRGVFTAPAGTDAALVGVTGPVVTTTRAEGDALNRVGVNIIRAFPNVGVVVWGARTQATDQEWKYVPVRRTVLFVEESISRGLGWVVFEPNGEPLWQRVRQSVTTFLMQQWQAGAFVGIKAEHAFFVKCDGTTMTQNDLDNGRLVCMIGLAPSRPSEFLILRIGMSTADAED